ncbi:MAG: hypothetical protein OXU81_14625, partial [Gammaproteobacteria bacterium]|nr:hypothetical protein [Gammaproteobacteria bacterium]
MPEIERGSSPSGASAYNALHPPELPARPAGGFRNRSVRSQTAERHERLWGRPIGEAALRLAGARQKAELSARAISVAPSSSERFLPDRRKASGEHTYEPLRVTASPQHVYERINLRAHTPSADPHRGIAPLESAVEEPHYEFAPQEPPVEEPHYEFAPQEPPVEEPHYEFAPKEPPVEEHDYDFPPPVSPLEESYGGSALGEADGEEPHYEFAPREPAVGEHIYDNPRNEIYESPAPSGLGSLNRLGVYLVNGLEGGTIPDELRDDLQTALVYAKQLDQDIGRAATLLDKLNDPGGALTESERQEVNSLIASNKHNLAVVQNWLAGREDELREHGSLTPETRAFFQALQTRIADRHMDLADLTCLYDLDEASPQEPVSREDRCNAHLLDAEAAVAVARGLQDVDPAVKDRLVADLEQHRDLLIRLKDAAGGRLDVPGDGRLALAAKELWETPVPLQKSGAGSGRDIAALRAQWRNTGPGHAAPLPVAHPKVGQARMLQEFIRFRLGEAEAAKGRTPNLKRLFHIARNQVINDQPWGEVTNRVRTSMPDEPDRSVTVESRIVPGKAFATRFAEGYPSNGINCSDRTQYTHVPNLAQTTLTNSSGEVLFSGFRHGVLDSYDIDAEYLASLTDADLRTMIADLLAPEAPADGSREAFVEEQLALIRSDPKAAQRAAETMRGQASREMASEMAVTALVADPEKLRDALDGKTVDVALSSISLLTPDSLRNLAGSARSDERTMLNHQTEALRQLAERNPVELRVRDDDGALRTVKVNVRLRQFNFGVNADAVGRARVGPVAIPSQTPGWRNLMGWGFAMDRNNPQLQRLLGEANAAGLGGDVADRLFLMRREAEQLAGEVDDIEAYIAMQEGEDTSDLDEEAAMQRAALASLNKRIETLDSAARQAKATWASNDYRRGGGDPFKMVSRLALVCHLMGETPLFNCKSGKDRTGQLDAEVKFLAAAADESGGRVPPPDESMETWRPVRNDFVFNTGNLEMQRLNTGLPGYKPATVAKPPRCRARNIA